MAASTKYVQKYTRKTPHQVKDEFFVQEKDIILIRQFRDKIENMHQIQIGFEEMAEGGQWLVLEGESVDRRNAKNYITAICNPAERKQVQFSSSSCAELTDPATLELVEKRTNAFIRPLKKIAQFEISGTELAVTLALSQIEELAGSVLKEGEDDEFDDEEASQEDGVITISPNMHKASKQLSSVLERALSANSDGICSVDDYRHTTPAVQRVLLNCLQADDNDDIDDDHLFADGPSSDSSMKGSKLMMFYEDGTDDSAEVMNVDKEKTVQTSPGVSAFAEKMTELNISNTETTPLRTKQQEYLRNFGLSVGFQEKEVDKALQFVDEKTRPSDFLDMLNSLQKQDEDVSYENDSGDDVVILETETIDLINDKKSVFHEKEKTKPDEKESCENSTVAGTEVQNQDKKQNNPTTLPHGYKERLLRDFITEDENCSVEELKRRNAERQKLLRQNFERDQESIGNQPNDQKQTGKKQNCKSKNRRKKNKQQKQNTENQAERSDMHDKQLRMDSGENQNRTYSNDEEQTCVLRIWNKDQEPGGSQSSEDSFQTTPKRKHNNNRNTPAQWPQQNAGNNFQRQNTPVHQAGGQWSHSQGPAGSGNFRKPTQVVTPVNVPNAGHRQPAHQDGCKQNEAELRYIVIDGSNVAMTHGNGKFSCKGIKICVDYFRQRGHDKITVFVPQWRQYRPSEDNPILDQNILYELKNEDILVFTPSRKIGRKLVAAYDDRFVLELAEAEDGIIVSNDQYRDLMTEKAAWRNLIEERLLMYSFVRDRFMPPNDPLGREGPCLDDFLRITKQVPVNRRHWQGNNYQNHQLQQQQYNQHYGHFQKGQAYFQPGEGHCQQGQVHLQPNQGHFKPGQSNFVKALNEGLQNTDNTQSFQKQGYGAKPKSYFQRQTDPQQLDEIDDVSSKASQGKGNFKGSVKGQGSFRSKGNRAPRTDEETEVLFKELRTIFPDDDQEDKVRNILANHEEERDLTKLTNYLMSVLF